MKRLSIFIHLLVGMGTLAMAQFTTDPILERLSVAQVKGLQNFIERFNGTELPPNVSAADVKKRDKGIFSLFDYQMEGGTREELFAKFTKFTTSVSARNLTIGLDDADWYAEAQCLMTYRAKQRKVNIVLRRERTQRGLWKWCLCGVNGMTEAGVFPNIKPQAISPVEHEVKFVELQQVINTDFANIVGYCSRDANVDMLSYFLALVNTGQLKFVQCDQVVYHFCQIPGYVFSVKEFPRQNDNSGWLIAELSETTENAKKQYVTKLLGKTNN